MTKGIVSFTTNPYCFTTLERARKKYGPTSGVPPDQCSYFLVKAKPDVAIPELCTRIKARVPDLDVHDRHSYSWICMEFWLTRTGIGISFGLAAFLGLLVGLAVVAQTLYASVTERIREFGTLKAMGASDSCISRFVLVQALGNAFFGSLIGLLVSFLISTTSTARAPVVLTWWIAAASVLLIVVVCVIAAYIPYWRIRRIDPACVLRGF
jgi:putative ABC transport system permease protein